MPFPVSVTGTGSDMWWAGRACCGEAIWHRDGTIYAAYRDMTNDTIEMWYSTATVSGTTTYARGELWQEADSAGHLASSTDTNYDHYAKAPSGLQIGDNIWLFYLDNSSQIEVSAFDVISKTWGTTIAGAVTCTPVDINGLPDPGGDLFENTIAPVQVDATTIRVFHNLGTLIGTATKTQFLPYYADLDLSAGTWGTQVIIDSSTDTGHDFMIRYALRGKDGMSHCFYNEGLVHPTDDDLFAEIGCRHISVSSDGTLGTAQVISSAVIANVFGWNRQGRSIYDPDLDEFRLIMPVNDGTATDSGGVNRRIPAYVYSTSEAQPTWGTNTVWNGTAWMEHSGGVELVCPNDFTRVWMFWGGRNLQASSVGNLFFAKTELGDTTAVSTTLDANASIQHLGARTVHLGDAIGYMWVRQSDPPPVGTYVFTNLYSEEAIDFCEDCCPADAGGGGGNYAYLS